MIIVTTDDYHHDLSRVFAVNVFLRMMVIVSDDLMTPSSRTRLTSFFPVIGERGLSYDNKDDQSIIGIIIGEGIWPANENLSLPIRFFVNTSLH
jgi:hypothetical protein